MIAGMGIVYVFLSILILVTRTTMSAIGRFDSIIPQEAPKKSVKKAAENDDENVALAIAVALGGAVAR